MLKKTIIYLYTFIHIFVTILTVFILKDISSIFIICSIFSYLTIILCSRNNADLTDITSCFYFTMGFWVRPLYNLHFNELNYFNYNTIYISITVFAAISLSSFLFTPYNSNNIISNHDQEPLQIEFNKYPNLFFIFFFVTVLYVTFYNFEYKIYQRGIETRGTYNSVVINMFSLLLNYGFLFYSVKLSSLMINNNKYHKFNFVPIIFEQFFTSLSILSRIMPVNAIIILYRSMKSYKIKYIAHINLLIILITGPLLIVTVQGFRSNYYINKDYKDLTFKDLTYKTLNYKIFHKTDWIFNRFIGIDGVYHINKYKNENPNSNLFYDLTFERRVKGVPPVYHNVIGYNQTNNAYNFVEIPGLIAYLSSGFDPYIIFFLFFLLLVIIKLLEVKISKLSYGDKMCGGIIAYFLVYRLVHSGVYILDTYKLITGLILIIFSYFFLNLMIKSKNRFL